MDFEPNEYERMAVESVRRCCEMEILPRIAKCRDKAFPRELAHELMEIVGSVGIGCGWVPEEAGGLGLPYVTSGLLYEELARHAPEVAGMAYVSEGAAMKVHRKGTLAQKERYLPGMLTGRIIGCAGITEPGTGSNVREMRTRAEPQDGGWRISGEKMFISNAGVADVITLLARTGERSFTLFLLDRERDGYEAREIEKLGLNGWSFASLAFDGMWVPDDAVLGEVGKGLSEVLAGIERARAWIAVISSGIAGAALAGALTYAKERSQFGVPIASHQLIQELLADMAMETEASKLLTYRALAALDVGLRADLPTSMAKVYASEAAVRVASKAIQVHGAYGVTREFDAERHFRNARMLTIPDGTTQINQLIIGREMTGISAFARA